MRLLIDTHLLVWAVSDEDRRSKMAVALMEDRANELWFSVASIWEIGIKRERRPQEMLIDAAQFRTALRDHGYREMNITSDHALASNALAWLHRDPFDRILIGQASVEHMPLLTADKMLARYAGPVRVV